MLLGFYNYGDCELKRNPMRDVECVNSKIANDEENLSSITFDSKRDEITDKSISLTNPLRCSNRFIKKIESFISLPGAFLFGFLPQS